jgi:hypothetical protein
MIFVNGQTKKQKNTKPQTIWTWDGKPIDEKTLRDSLKVFYLKHIDSISKQKIKFS